MSNIIRMPFEFQGAAAVMKDASDLEQLTRILVSRYGEEAVIKSFFNAMNVIEMENNDEILEQFVGFSK